MHVAGFGGNRRHPAGSARTALTRRFGRAPWTELSLGKRLLPRNKYRERMAARPFRSLLKRAPQNPSQTRRIPGQTDGKSIRPFPDRRQRR